MTDFEVGDRVRGFYSGFEGVITKVNGRKYTIRADDGRTTTRDKGARLDPVPATLTSTEPSDSTNPKDLIGVRKPQLDKVPPAAIIQIAKAMENGAAKYGPFNWREKKVKSSVYLAAAQRHILSWADGEDVAEDSGVHHLAHAAACLAILLDAEATGSLVDDRPAPGAAARLITELTEGGS